MTEIPKAAKADALEIRVPPEIIMLVTAGTTRLAPRKNAMARAKNAGNGRLEEALATLIQNQASFLARMSEIDLRVAEMDRINSERFARIEALLLEHNRILQALPDAIRDKIGFKAPAS